MLKIKKYSVKTSSGPMLEINEDDCSVDLVNNLFLILDGFGGIPSGATSVSSILEMIKTFYTKIGGDPDSTLPFYFSHKYLIEGNALINALQYVHAKVCKDNYDKPIDSRGGSSVIAASLAENIMSIASIGNCVSYFYRRGDLERVTKPDILKDVSGDGFSFEFNTSPMSAVGIFDDLPVNIIEKRVMPGDVMILLTDGVYSRIKESELKYVIESSTVPFDQMAHELFQLSNSRGNLDNQTAVFMQF